MKTPRTRIVRLTRARSHEGGFPCEGRLTYLAQGAHRSRWVPLRVRDEAEMVRVRAQRG